MTLLVTVLEGSTALLAAHPTAYRAAVRRHHALLREAVAGHGGAVFETVGNAVYAAFAWSRRTAPARRPRRRARTRWPRATSPSPPR